MIITPQQKKALGAIYGHLLGDAFGVPYEFMEAAEIGDPVWRGHGTHDQPKGTWSDDGALMLCQLSSLLDKKGFDPEDTGANFVKWADDGFMAIDNKVFDIGNTTHSAIMKLQRKEFAAIDCGPDDDWSNGNGSLMRILPVGLVHWVSPIKEVIENSMLSSRITHGHLKSQISCAVYNLLVAEFMQDNDINWGYQDGWNARLAEIKGLITEVAGGSEDLDFVMSFDQRNGSGFVVDCLWSAMHALVTTDNFEDCIKKAVSFGEDTDTTACVAGGLAGIRYGFDGLPKEWLDDLRITEEQKIMISNFVKFAI